MSYIALATTTLGSAASSVTFSSIPASVNGVALRDLILVCNYSIPTSSTSYIFFNGNDANTTSVRMGGTGSGSGYTDTYTKIFMSAGNQTDGQFAIAQIMDFSATDKHKTALSRNGYSGTLTQASAGRWASTNAITSVTIENESASQFNAGSIFSLYGVA
jgi:hypothetical protein